ncbi:DJ-1/PfpI family protein [Kineosporia babensis]
MLGIDVHPGRDPPILVGMERSVLVVGYEGAELLDIACVTTTLALANLVGRLEDPYRISVAAPGGRPILCQSGLVLQADASVETHTGPLDTLVVSGGITYNRAADDNSLVAHVRRLARDTRRVASVCTGASVLAATGLLDGRRATTHWFFAADIAKRFPKVTVDAAPIFIRDGSAWTAAGVTSALDLSLAFVEEDHGVELARRVSRQLVTYLQRPGNQSQMSIFTAAPAPQHGLVRRVTEHVQVDLAADLSLEALAGLAGVSPRHLTRLFLQEVGEAPGRYVRRARTSAAANLLETTTLPLPAIANRCGLGTAENLRKAFTEYYGVPPSAYRRTQKSPG